MGHMFDFGEALSQMRQGAKVHRKSWNGPNQWVALHLATADMSKPYIYIHTTTGDLVPWTISQTDALSYDWEIASVPDTAEP